MAQLERRHPAHLSRAAFEVIADIINTLPDAERVLVADVFAKALDRTNPNFKEDRFINRATLGKRG